MLAEFNEIQDILVCPRSGRPLVQAGEVFRPVYDGRIVGEICYFSIQGQPVLIDYDKSVVDLKDILMREGGPILPRKKNRLKSWIKDHLLSPAAYQLAGQNSERFAQMLKESSPEPRLLIIGGGSKGIGTDIFYDDPDIQVIGFDIYASPLTHFLADAHQIPIATETIDGIWVQYVLEHVLDPWRVATEIHRVLKQEGIVYAETPFLQQVHEGAYDFVRFTHSGHRWLFRHFSEIKSGTSMGPGVQLLWTLEHTVRGLFRSRTAGRAAKLAFFWLQFIEKVIPGRYRVDSASSIYFVGRKAQTPIRPKDIVGYYQGAQHL
jgi:SAM-dependent methyltransferase